MINLAQRWIKQDHDRSKSIKKMKVKMFTDQTTWKGLSIRYFDWPVFISRSLLGHLTNVMDYNLLLHIVYKILLLYIAYNSVTIYDIQFLFFCLLMSPHHTTSYHIYFRLLLF